MARKISLLVTFVLVLTVTGPLQAENKERSIKSGIRTVVSETVAVGKDLVSGVAEGLDDGRKSGESVDGAKIVSNKDDLAKLLILEVLKAQEQEDGNYQVTVALRNQGAAPVRLINLSGLGNVALLDVDGFAYPLPRPIEQGRDVTVLANSATRFRVVFEQVEGRPKFFRLFNLDFPIPAN